MGDSRDESKYIIADIEINSEYTTETATDDIKLIEVSNGNIWPTLRSSMETEDMNIIADIEEREQRYWTKKVLD